MSKIKIYLTKDELKNIINHVDYSLSQDPGLPVKEDTKLFNKLKETLKDFKKEK